MHFYVNMSYIKSIIHSFPATYSDETRTNIDINVLNY